jgi:hypothetical protein
VIEDIKYNMHGFDRFNYRRRPTKTLKTIVENFIIVNYHLIGYIKKIILILLIIISHLAPKTAL